MITKWMMLDAVNMESNITFTAKNRDNIIES